MWSCEIAEVPIQSELNGEVENGAVPLLCSRRDAGGHADCLVWGHNWLLLGFDTS